MMPKYVALCLAALLLPAAVLARDDDPEPRPRPAKPRAIRGVGPIPATRGSYDRPTRITTAKQLGEVVNDRKAEAAILKAVDFGKEHLLLFCWSGSRADSLAPAEGKVGEATTSRSPAARTRTTPCTSGCTPSPPGRRSR
jgi:hypothetical protein